MAEAYAFKSRLTSVEGLDESCGVSIPEVSRENQIVVTFLNRSLGDIHHPHFVSPASPPESLGNIGRN